MVLKVTSTAICGSDLHLFEGYMPGMQKGDILGHEVIVPSLIGMGLQGAKGKGGSGRSRVQGAGEGNHGAGETGGGEKAASQGMGGGC